MSGHSKWSTIKRKKGALDAKRGKIFTKLIKEITVAARVGGGNVEANPRLRSAVQTARENNMPFANIDRAVKKGTGEIEGATYEEVTYEGYGPGGTALFIESLTDNKNRTVAEIRSILTKNNGNLGANGSVAWMFEKKGVIVVNKTKAKEDQLMEIALEAGAEDISDEKDAFEIRTDPCAFETTKEALEKNKIQWDLTEVSMVPKNTVKLAGKEAEQMLRLMESLEDCDDVQKVYSNFDIDESEMEKIATE
ncbi:MAG: YebC/PmpR family DNA-binding transcriptional regulator [Deltaproteobacteria bacterium]|nr:YebC/PmpR family DNA-binding transcriptional regulator [Deltaproteobacteria bacterium]